MRWQEYNVEVQADFIERQAKARPVQALAELIWNSLDADATRVEVKLESNEIGVNKIRIRDNGTGIAHKDAPELFTRLGGSWKRSGELTTTKGRMLHGHEGRGRLRVFALGRVADWQISYCKNANKINQYSITMLQDKIGRVRIADEQNLEDGETGVEIVISELHRHFSSLECGKAVPELREIFALYLMNYRDVSIDYQGQPIDPSALTSATKVLKLTDIGDGSKKSPAELEIVEWNCKTSRSLFLCTSQGFPLLKTEANFQVGGFNFVAYLKSDFIERLHNDTRLSLAEMDPNLANCIEESRQAIKTYFRDRSADMARTVVEEWKADKIYPFEGEAKDALEDAERKVFDILAVTASNYIPDFQNAPLRKRRFDLRMLRTAIEKSPEDLQLIMQEVLDLPQKKQHELADLLREASLSSIINAASTVADRLKFLSGLELILFDRQARKDLKERSQLHQILADNTWLFGEEYNLSVSDRSLTEVLRKHHEILGNEIVIDRPVKHISKKRGIVDLMMSRSLRRHRANDLDHLVVELKAPRVRIGQSEVNQIEQYAFSVTGDERFRHNHVRWTFWVISDDIDSYAENRIMEGKEAQGTIYKKNDCMIAIKTWGQVIEDNKVRLQFFQEKLNHQVDSQTALSYLKEKYRDFLSGIAVESEKENSA